MTDAAPLHSQINLLFALLARFLALWAPGAKASVQFVRVVERTERDLADAIRVALAQDGVAFPVLDDAAFLIWFARDRPGSEQTPHKRRTACAHAGRLRSLPIFAGKGADGPMGAVQLDRRLRATLNNIALKPAAQPARAPP